MFKNIIFKIIYILVIIYLLIYVPCIWGHRPLVVVSGSMKPIFNVGGLIYYENIELDEYKVGDILVYKVPAHIVSHRIVEIKEDGFITRGDANKNNDGLIRKNQVLGRATNTFIPLIGYYADFIYHHKYLLIITLVLVLIDMIYSKRDVNVKNE